MELKRAWIVRWEYLNETQVSDVAAQNEVVAVLPFSWGHKRVKEVLERLYKERLLTLREKVYWRNAESGPYKVQCMSYLHKVPVIDYYYAIGHEPSLVAHQAKNIQITGQNEMTWQEEAVKHVAWMCEAAGEKDCEEAGQPPYVQRYTYNAEV